MQRAKTIQVAIDVGSENHWVGIGVSEGEVLEEFEVEHTQRGFENFFRRVERHRRRLKRPVEVAMEGYNGWARPLDTQIQQRGYRLLNVNNLKLARYKEIFPGPAKNEQIDARKMLELFQLQRSLPLAKEVLQEVGERPTENLKLKRLTRRRRQLVQEKVGLVSRLHSDLQAVCPELASITGALTNLWFLRFLTCRKDLRQLSRIHLSSVLKIQGIGRRYAQIIQEWQAQASFSSEVSWVGPMILSDARRLLELLAQIDQLEQQIVPVARQSAMARRIDTIPGFGTICSSELAGEIGTLDRFEKEASLALYLGMTVLEKSSGKQPGTQRTRQFNRRARLALMAAVAQHIRQVPESKVYYDKKRAEGKRHNQAVRALGRHLVRVIWWMLTQERNYEVRSK